MAIYPVRWNEPFPDACRDGALTIGNFDGVHRGHQALLEELRLQAGNIGGPAVAMTLEPHPVQLLRPGTTPAALTTLDDRTRLMQAHGADHVIVLQTTAALLEQTARAFFDVAIRRGLRARAVVPGFNFVFGHNREGTAALLAELCREAGVVCTPVPPLHVDGLPVSSSRIRGELAAGNVAAAAMLLGRPYSLTGIVGTGQQRGHKIGFPTANLEEVATVVPGNGVYATVVHHAGRSWAGAANIGPNPTFGEQDRKIEVHLLDFAGELKGVTLTVEFLERLRETRRFAGAAELVAQLHADIAAARRIVEDSLRGFHRFAFS
jgi:riboflavin kinase / FMN adenylyltransferase